MIGKELDIYIKERVKDYLDKNKFPEFDNVQTDTFSEIIDKLIIVHIRYWYLEDAMAIEKDDIKLASLRRKSESLFKQKRPMLVEAIDKMIISIINGNECDTSNVKHYKGWNI